MEKYANNLETAYIYALDKFIQTDLTIKDVMVLFNSDPIKLVECIKDLIEEDFGTVEKVRFISCNVENGIMMIKYFVYTRYGRVPIAVIHITESEEIIIKV